MAKSKAMPPVGCYIAREGNIIRGLGRTSELAALDALLFDTWVKDPDKLTVTPATAALNIQIRVAGDTSYGEIRHGDFVMLCTQEEAINVD